MNPVNTVSLWFAKKAQRWLARNVPSVSSVSLHRKNIFILPTTQGLLFAAATVLIFVTAINYILSLAFALAFLMVSVFVLSILHAFRNLHHLTVKGTGAAPVFAGEDATFVVLLQRNAGRLHEMLELFFPRGLVSNANLLSGDQERVNVYLPTSRRGLLKAPRLRVQTRFPLGLWCAWSTLDLDMSCLVYPAPVASAMPGVVTASHSGNAESTHPGTEDFHGLRSYQPGDSLKHVAWKNLARGQGLKIKQFVDNADDRLMLDWAMYPALDAEERLSRLCYWVLSLSRSNMEYGLRLPGVDIPTGRGDVHRERLLSALALWNLKESEGEEGAWT